MTANKVFTRKKRRGAKLAYLPHCILPCAVLLLVFAFLTDQKDASSAISLSLCRCARSLIPSLFPCMVLSSLVGALGGGELLGKLFGGAFSFVFGISGPSASALILGFLCGFPVGASYAVSLYKNGSISKDELEKLIGLASVPSPAFTVNVVGSSLFDSKELGIALACAVIFSSFLCSLIFRGKRRTASSREMISLPPKKVSIASAFSSAISESALSMLRVCACVVFFSAVSAMLTKKLPTSLGLAVSGFLEFSGGCDSVARSASPIAFPLCAAILGWSGLSVHFQIISVCGDTVSYKKYYIISLLKSAFSFITAFVVKMLLFDV